MDWNPPPRPAELAETRLISAILDGTFPIGTTLPAERELCTKLGVTRPTLREALQRMARDGWIEIHQGRSTRVRDFWREGNLGVLGAIAHHADHLPQDFVPNLLIARLALAPTYTRMAIERRSPDVIALLKECKDQEDTPHSFGNHDWSLHHTLTVASGNPAFTLIVNGFRELYLDLAPLYFSSQHARDHARAFYARLLEAALADGAQVAETITRQAMRESVDIWRLAASQASGGTP